MEQIPLAGYSETISLYSLGPAAFRAVAADTALSLGWHPLYAEDRYLLYHTRTGENFIGETVSIRIGDPDAYIEVVPLNEYYWDEAQLQHRVSSFKETLEAALPDLRKAERGRNPLHREKYGALVPSATYKATPLLAYGLVLVYLVMIGFGVHPLTPGADSLFTWGGNFRDAVTDGQWWRLLSYMFLHAGAMHLLMNLFALLYIGMYLEPVVGTLKVLGAYLFTGIIAGMTSIIMHPFSVGVGASGAIFGLYGVFFALLTTGYFQKTARMTMMRSLLFFIVFNLLMGLQGNTDNAAHVGGLLGGIATGYLYYPSVEEKTPLHHSA